MALIKDKILVIEDEKSISYLLGTVLTANGYDVIKAYTGTEACEMLDAYCPDLILLDLGLPDMDGVDIIRRVRSRGTAPIVVVSARTRERDKIEALDLGADDYITKPFGGGELLARVRAALRHARNQVAGPSYTQTGVYRAGELCIDFDRHLVQLEGQDVHLTQSEYKIVSLLTRYAGKVLTYDFIIREIWGEKATGDTQNLRANMAKIRRKLEKNPGKPQYILQRSEWVIGWRRENRSRCRQMRPDRDRGNGKLPFSSGCFFTFSSASDIIIGLNLDFQ